MKLDFGPGYRVYYARQGNTTVVLLGGGDKSDQTKDIETARNLWEKFEEQGSLEQSLARWSQEAQPPGSETPEPEKPPAEKKEKKR